MTEIEQSRNGKFCNYIRSFYHRELNINRFVSVITKIIVTSINRFSQGIIIDLGNYRVRYDRRGLHDVSARI